MWPSDTDTVELLNQARAGDISAVNQLLEKHRVPLRRMIQMRLDAALARRVDASDVVQDVMLEAGKRLDDYLRSSSMPFHLWLRHLARDHIIDSHRRHRLAQRRSIEREQPIGRLSGENETSFDGIASLMDPELTPAGAALQRELQARFESALVDMNDDDREIILLRHFEHLSNQEAAQSLGLSAPAASMRYLRAIRRLRDLIAPKGEEA